MLQSATSQPTACLPPHAAAALGSARLEQLFRNASAYRRPLAPQETLFRAGQPRHALHFVQAGCVRTSLLTDDGREKITGFRLRGELLGLDALDLQTYTGDAVSLDVGEVLELPITRLHTASPALHEAITGALTAEIRRDWRWMLATGTLSADRRVAEFLVDMGERLERLGIDGVQLVLRMSRAEIGNFLALTLETVARALTRLQDQHLIEVRGRHIGILDRMGLRDTCRGGTAVH